MYRLLLVSGLLVLLYYLLRRAIRKMKEDGGAVLICGRYEGIDQRFIDSFVTDQISLGDFVLSGGEIAAITISTPNKVRDHFMC